MRNMLRTYRAYLTRKANEAGPGAAGRIEMGWQTARWMALLLVPGSICHFFELTGKSAWLVVGPFLVVTLAGIVFVWSVFPDDGD